ncbi:MaoC/PaaZ C-terminal domain-containing protein, partial [Streptomyces spectabilis]|uniref:MaoC/PaaZ C-terminal domain-containing protein n=1 Tax=Streptomyces spectabilis TaxID=68270 RepID=UPI0033E2ADB5
MRVFTSPDELPLALGEDLGVSPWHVVDQRQIDGFAAATGDHQWIHVDAERARTGPFGGTIAHGFLTVALLPLSSRWPTASPTASTIRRTSSPTSTTRLARRRT